MHNNAFHDVPKKTHLIRILPLRDNFFTTSFSLSKRYNRRWKCAYC